VAVLLFRKDGVRHRDVTVGRPSVGCLPTVYEPQKSLKWQWNCLEAWGQLCGTLCDLTAAGIREVVSNWKALRQERHANHLVLFLFELVGNLKVW